MPVPISSQVYIPDPLVGPRAGAAGFDIGKQSSPFANFVAGAFQGAKDTANIADTLQQIEFRPQEQARADREQQSMEEYRRKNNEQQDAQLEFQKYKFQQEYDLEKQKEARYRTSAAIAQGNQALNATADGIVAQAVVGGDLSGIEAAVRSGDRRLQMALFSAINKDPDVATTLNYAMQDSISRGMGSNELIQFSENLSHAKTLEDAAKGAQGVDDAIQKRIGVKPSDGRQVKSEPKIITNPDGTTTTDDSVHTVYELWTEKGPDGELIPRKEPVGVLHRGDPKQDQAADNEFSAWNNKIRASQRMREEKARQMAERAGIQQAARQPGYQFKQAPNATEEGPAKLGPRQRTNSAQTKLQPVEQSVKEIDEAKRRERNIQPNPRQKEALDRLRKTANSNYQDKRILWTEEGSPEAAGWSPTNDSGS